MRGISWLAENRLPQEGLCSLELVSKQVSKRGGKYYNHKALDENKALEMLVGALAFAYYFCYVRPSVRTYYRCFHCTNVSKIWHCTVIWQSVEKVQIRLKSCNNVGHLTCPTSKYVYHCWRNEVAQKALSSTELLWRCDTGREGINIKSSVTRSRYTCELER